MYGDGSSRDLLVKFLWFGWLVASIGGPLLGYILYKVWPQLTRRVQRVIAAALSAIVLAAVCDSAGPISFCGFALDAAVTALGYVAFCGLFVVLIREAAVWLRVLLAAAGTLGMGFVALGVCTVMGFWMVASQETFVAPHLLMRVTEEGVAHNTATVELVSEPWHVSGLERTQWSRSVRDDECDANQLHVAIQNDEGTLLCGQTVLEPIKLY